MTEGFIIRALRWVELLLYRRAAAVVVVTASFKDNLVARGITPEKIHVVYNGADLSWCRPLPRDTAFVAEFGLEEKFTAGYFGTLGLAHALDKVLDAAEMLKDREDIRLLFVGAGAKAAQLRQSVLERGLSNVHFSEPKPKIEMSRLWSVCDLALIPLNDHPVFANVIPSKLFEAVAHNVPVLMALPKGEATSIVETTGCGLTVPPENAAAMAQAIRSLADDRSRLMELRRAAAAAAPQFSREVQAGAMLEVLRGVAAGAC
jgi:glycosyltransferase involved in cell wall biosynthesis